MTAKSLESLTDWPIVAVIVVASPPWRSPAVHVALALLYAVTLWLALLLYAAIGGLAWGAVLAWAPVIISALVAALLVLDLVGCIVAEAVRGVMASWRDE